MHRNTPRKRNYVWICPHIRRISIHAIFLSGQPDTVYRRYPTTIDDFVQIVRDECGNTHSMILENIVANFVLRLRHVVSADGEHFEKIVTRFPSALGGLKGHLTF
ncbi:hypothetical protein AVEN_201392-1 [Araneus ventricosus]|uniref:DUF4817 domain-containing protein n=1 Tax=Araneus ventricosus TaxID=182803 RepID=A0A4Y2ARV3_ARAVE|nr:hypothetical protein AVEN_201392-1 [Araneus ventricosus]